MALWRGEITRRSGFADAGRNYLCALASVGYRDVFLHYGGIDWNDPDFRAGGAYVTLADAFAGVDIRKVTQDTVVVHHEPASVHRFVVPTKRNIALTAWETDRLSPDGRFILDASADEVWVPSEHNRRAVAESGVTKPIHVIPHAHGPWRLPDAAVPFWKKNRYVFYYIGSDNARKNPQQVLRAFLEEFGPDDPVALVYKVWNQLAWNADSGGRVERVSPTQRVCAAVKQYTNGRCPPVVVGWGSPPMNDILMLHAWGDCFVSAHRGEAWGLAMSQAKWFGRKVIATGWSGPCDYLDPAVDDLLPYELVPVDPTSMGFRPGFQLDQKWAQVDHKALRDAMRLAFETRARGSNAGMERFSWQAVGRMMVERLSARA